MSDSPSSAGAIGCLVPALQGVALAGKTGTAQTGSLGRGLCDHAWFVGFAPAENPKIVTFPGSPPKVAMLRFTHCRAAIWSM